MNTEEIHQRQPPLKDEHARLSHDEDEDRFRPASARIERDHNPLFQFNRKQRRKLAAKYRKQYRHAL